MGVMPMFVSNKCNKPFCIIGLLAFLGWKGRKICSELSKWKINFLISNLNRLAQFNLNSQAFNESMEII